MFLLNIFCKLVVPVFSNLLHLNMEHLLIKKKNISCKHKFIVWQTWTFHSHKKAVKKDGFSIDTDIILITFTPH